MKILDNEVNFDFFDADNMEKFEQECSKVLKECENEDIKKLSCSEAIRCECKIIDNFFNNLFGSGTAEKIFKGKCNLQQHIVAFQDIINEKNRKSEDLQNTLNRYKPNRQERRGNERKYNIR